VGLPYLDGVHLVAASEPPPVWPPADGWSPDPYQGAGLNSWSGIKDSLIAFGRDGILRRPGQVFLEVWSRFGRLDPRSAAPMMTGLAMSLCLSDGAYLYADPDWWRDEKGELNSGQHSWYSAWDRSLGAPLEGIKTSPNSEGFFQREFEEGWAVYVPASLSAVAEIELSEEALCPATGKRSFRHQMNPGQGGLFLKTDLAQ
jgi:hypothetical protein